MRTLWVLILLPILPVAIGRSTVVIKQVVNNAEVLLNTTQLNASFGDQLKFRCYVNVSYDNMSFVHNDVEWHTPYFSHNFELNGSSVLVIPGVEWSNEGEYMCVSHRRFVRKGFYLKVNFPYPNMYITELPKFYKEDFLKHQPMFFQPNFTDNNYYYNLTNYTDKGPIFFVPAVIVIILGIVRMCYFLKGRRNVTWERLTTLNCNHNVCNHRRRTNPSATCLLQNQNSDRLSVVIVGQLSEGDSSSNELDVPPAYNEVIPQDLPPTYTEAVANTDNTSSTRT